MRVKKTFRLSEETVKKIEQVAIEENIAQARAIDHVVKKYFERKNQGKKKQ